MNPEVEFNKYYKWSQEEIESQREVIVKYRKALEFYADENNWRAAVSYPTRQIMIFKDFCESLDCCGKRARAVLEEFKKGTSDHGV